MRRLVVAFVVLACLVAVAPARAGEVSLWACRGPAGEALGPVLTAATGDTVVEPGCARARFTRPDPAAGSEALARVDVPPVTTLTSVRLDRLGRGPGYSALTSAGALETADGDGVATFTTGGEWVALRLRCEAAERCADAGNAAFELRSATLVVQDTSQPAFAVGGLRDPATGTLALEIQATDGGAGLWRATASLDDTPVAGASFGGCTELSPADATVDLAVGALCPGVGQTGLAVDTTTVPDGQHTLRVVVTDAAGNTTQQTHTFTVLNPVATPTPRDRRPTTPDADAEAAKRRRRSPTPDPDADETRLRRRSDANRDAHQTPHRDDRTPTPEADADGNADPDAEADTDENDHGNADSDA